MNELVVKLYLVEWKDATRIAHELVPSEEAPEVVRQLSLSSGWRERVTAAKVAFAFELRELVAPLVHTFSANPEAYTAFAFSKLMNIVAQPERGVLMSELLNSCPATSYGEHLREVIEKNVSPEPVV